MMQAENDRIKEHWFLSNEQTFKGPFDDSQITQMIQQGEIQKTDRLWSRTQNDWLPVSQISQFAQVRSVIESNTNIKVDPKDWNSSDEFWSYIQSRHQNLNNQSTLLSPLQKHYRPMSKGRALSAGFLVSALIGLFVFRNLNTNYQNMNLNLKDNQIAKEIISQSSSKFGPRFSIFQSTKDKMIVATNLENGSEIRLKLEGIPDTLVGAFQSQYQKDMIVENGYFEISLLSQNRSQSFPEGEYNLQFFCLKCLSEVQNQASSLFEQKIFLGGAQDESYDLRLSQYHTKLREQAKEELNDFLQLSESLMAQVKSMSVERWDFSTQQLWLSRHGQWRLLQDQLVSEVNRLSQADSEGAIYYSELMETVVLANENIKKLEAAFIESMKLQSNSERTLKRIEFGKKSAEIIERLNTVNQRVHYFMNKPLTSTGMPRNK